MSFALQWKAKYFWKIETKTSVLNILKIHQLVWNVWMHYLPTIRNNKQLILPIIMHMRGSWGGAALTMCFGFAFLVNKGGVIGANRFSSKKTQYTTKSGPLSARQRSAIWIAFHDDPTLNAGWIALRVSKGPVQYSYRTPVSLPLPHPSGSCFD